MTIGYFRNTCAVLDTAVKIIDYQNNSVPVEKLSADSFPLKFDNSSGTCFNLGINTEKPLWGVLVNAQQQ